jgi:hypothetical protein
MPANDFFWRNYIGAEVDYVQMKNEMTKAYECKWSSKRAPKPPKAFVDHYSNAEFAVINQENFINILKP